MIVDEERTSKIKDIVAEHLEIDRDELSDSNMFIDDYAADSLSLIDLLAALEKEFNVVIEQSELGRMVNIDGVRAVLSEAAGQ